MANVTIPNLTSATTIAPSTDLMVLEQTEGTRKATLSQIFTSSATSGSGLGITSGGVYTIKSGLDSDISDINTLLGDTSIASIGDGTVTGAVSQINSDLTTQFIMMIQGQIPVNQSIIYVPYPAGFNKGNTHLMSANFYSPQNDNVYCNDGLMANIVLTNVEITINLTPTGQSILSGGEFNLFIRK